MTMDTLRLFGSTQQAREYRHNNGTGGWIFAADNEATVILFPPYWPPSKIFHHPLTRGMTGQLIA